MVIALFLIIGAYALDYSSFLQKKNPLSIHNIEEQLLYLQDVPDLIKLSVEKCPGAAEDNAAKAEPFKGQADNVFALCKGEQYNSMAEQIQQALDETDKILSTCPLPDRVSTVLEHVSRRIDEAAVVRTNLGIIKEGLDNLAYNLIEGAYDLLDAQVRTLAAQDETYNYFNHYAFEYEEDEAKFNQLWEQYKQSQWIQPIAIIQKFMPRLCPAWEKLDQASREYAKTSTEIIKATSAAYHDSYTKYREMREQFGI